MRIPYLLLALWIATAGITSIWGADKGSIVPPPGGATASGAPDPGDKGSIVPPPGG